MERQVNLTLRLTGYILLQGMRLKMKTLIVYGTRYGATAGTSEEIAKVLCEEDVDVRVVNAKKEKVRDITEYELIIVGNGMKFTGWTSEAKGFLRKFAKELATKKLAVFVSSAAQLLHEHKGEHEKMEEAWTKYLVDEIAKYDLNPIAMAIFGGWVNPENMGWLDKKMAKFFVEEMEAAGIKGENGVYDTRDWDAIRKWTKELVQKARA
jgi:menaquinone-dependent protoporphyrinogen oxidase